MSTKVLITYGIWTDMEVSSTRNDPGVVARYYVHCIKQLEGTARVVRAD